jgi:hypothetical protein
MTTEAATIGLTHGASEDTGLGHRGPQSKNVPRSWLVVQQQNGSRE